MEKAPLAKEKVNVLCGLKNRLIFENVLQKARLRYVISKELDAANEDFDFLNVVSYDEAYFKAIPIDEMLYSILVDKKVYTELKNPIFDDINVIDEFIATIQHSQKHEQAYILLLIGSIKKYTGKLTRNKLFNLYVATVYNWFTKYDSYHNINSLCYIMNKVMKEIFLTKDESFDLINISIDGISKTFILNNFSPITFYIYLEGLENKDLDLDITKGSLNQNTDDIEVATITSIYKNCFSFIDRIELGMFKKEITVQFLNNYIQTVGVNYYKNYVMMIVDRLPIIDEIELDFRFTTFITSIKIHQVLDDDVFICCAMEFAKRGHLHDSILAVLKKINSKSADEYMSYMIMEEIK